MKKVAFVLALALAATPLVASNGNWKVGHNEIHVVDDTIDVETIEGRVRLLARVERAAKTLCEAYPHLTRRARRECEADIVRQTAGRQLPWNRALVRAIDERNAVRMAGR